MDSLDVIITTSYVQSCPSTSLIDKTIESLSLLIGIDNLVLYIICDGYNIIPNGNRKFIKSGLIYQQDALDYEEYITNLYSKYTSKNIIILKQKDHNGYAKNVKYCVDNYIKSKYFMILQHDHIFIKNINVNNIINCLELNDINYIGFPSITNSNEVNNRLVRIEFRKFLLDIESAINDYIKLNDDNRNKIINKKEYEIYDKKGNINFLIDQTPNRDLVTNIILNYFMEIYGLKLMPLVFWYDKTHVCRTDYYRNNIFNNNDDIKIISFIEDTFGINQKNDIIKNGIGIFDKYKSFLYYDNFPDNIIIKHNCGRHFLTDDDRLKRITLSKSIKKDK